MNERFDATPQTREGNQAMRTGILSFMKIRIKQINHNQQRFYIYCDLLQHCLRGIWQKIFIFSGSESTLKSKGHKRPVLNMIFR